MLPIYRKTHENIIIIFYASRSSFSINDIGSLVLQFLGHVIYPDDLKGRINDILKTEKNAGRATLCDPNGHWRTDVTNAWILRQKEQNTIEQKLLAQVLPLSNGPRPEI